MAVVFQLCSATSRGYLEAPQKSAEAPRAGAGGAPSQICSSFICLVISLGFHQLSWSMARGETSGAMMDKFWVSREVHRIGYGGSGFCGSGDRGTRFYISKNARRCQKGTLVIVW